MKKGLNQVFTPEGEDYQERCCQAAAHCQLESEGMTHPIVIPAAVELGSQDACSRHDTEYADIEHKHELVGDGHAGHGFGSHLSHHNIIQHTHEIGDGILHDDRHHDNHDFSIKSPVSDEGGQAVFFPDSVC